MTPSELLELPEARELVPRVSVEMYHQLGEAGLIPRQTELIRGVIIKKVSKSPLHCSISKGLYDRFLRLAPARYSVWSSDPLTFIDSEPEPDLSVVEGDVHQFVAEHPRTAELVVEIAVSSVALDRANVPLYAEIGVKEYWIVLARQQAVEVYRDLRDGAYRDKSIYQGDEELVCVCVPELRIRVAEIFR